MKGFGHFSEEVIEKGQSIVQSSSKGVKKGASDFGKSAAGQLTGSDSSSNSDQNLDQGTNEQNQAIQTQNQQMTDEEAQEFLQNLYGPKNSQQSAIRQSKTGHN